MGLLPNSEDRADKAVQRKFASFWLSNRTAQSHHSPSAGVFAAISVRFQPPTVVGGVRQQAPMVTACVRRAFVLLSIAMLLPAGCQGAGSAKTNLPIRSLNSRSSPTLERVTSTTSRDTGPLPSIRTRATLGGPSHAPAVMQPAPANLDPHMAACREGDPLTNVSRPARLKVERRCIGVQGVVDRTTTHPDADVFIDMRLGPADAGLLNQRNISAQQGDLVAEIVPADQAGCTPGQTPKLPKGSDAFGICSGQALPAPMPGDLIQVYGPYVLDLDNGWMEVHPAWAMLVLRQNQHLPPAPNSIASNPTLRAPMPTITGDNIR